MNKLFSALAGLFMLGSVGAASAAEPVTLTEAQMDGVTAGVSVLGPYLYVNISGTLNSVAGLDTTFQTETFFVVAQ